MFRLGGERIYEEIGTGIPSCILVAHNLKINTWLEKYDMNFNMCFFFVTFPPSLLATWSSYTLS